MQFGIYRTRYSVWGRRYLSWGLAVSKPEAGRLKIWISCIQDWGRRCLSWEPAALSLGYTVHDIQFGASGI